jgi:hypothetical protein
MTARIEEQDPNMDGIEVLLEKPLNLRILMQALKEFASQKWNLAKRWHLVRKNEFLKFMLHLL